MDRHKLFGFTDVDQTADAGYYVRFLDAVCAEPSSQEYKRHSLALLGPVEGRRFLDVGCGPGDDARALAAQVGAGGAVVAVDGSRAMIDEAQRRAAGCGLPIEFRVADAHYLDLADGSFDGSRCDRTFMHLEEPKRALAEMVRVTRPGGAVVVYEVDFETVVVDADRSLGRRVVNCWCDGFRDGWIGRKVPRLFHDAGLREVAVFPHTLRLTYFLASQLVGPATTERAVAAGVLRADEARAWLEQLEAAEKAGRFFATLGGFLVAGRKG
jgi:ubiquinone/menaquinone biosynthesis C-methylase UbiE